MLIHIRVKGFSEEINMLMWIIKSVMIVDSDKYASNREGRNRSCY